MTTKEQEIADKFLEKIAAELSTDTGMLNHYVSAYQAFVDTTLQNQRMESLKTESNPD